MGNFFTDVIKKDPRFHSTNRISDIALLEPVTRAAVQAVISDAAAQAHLAVSTGEVDAALRNVAHAAGIDAPMLILEATRQGLAEADYKDELARQPLRSARDATPHVVLAPVACRATQTTP